MNWKMMNKATSAWMRQCKCKHDLLEDKKAINNEIHWCKPEMVLEIKLFLKKYLPFITVVAAEKSEKPN